MSEAAGGPTDRGAWDESQTHPPQSPWRMFWRQFKRSHLALVGGALLAVFYTVAVFAPFLAPYRQESMDRDRFFHPPQRLHWIDAGGHFHLPAFIHPMS